MSLSREDYSELRKKQQAEGVLPEWFTTQGFISFEKSYRYEAENFREQARRIAGTLSRHLPPHLKMIGFSWFFKLIWNGWMSCSTPVLANTGTNRGLPVSCSGGQIIGDSILEFGRARLETEILTKAGMGTGGVFSNIRPRGSSISNGQKASGSIPVYQDFINSMKNVTQGGRRGSFAGYWELDHGDVPELLEFLKSSPDDANAGLIVRDKHIEEIEKGGVEALFENPLHTRLLTGKPYFAFIDKVNRRRPKMYVDKGLYVEASQLCVAPETLILTDKGYVEIKSVANQQVNIWNGEEWSEVTPVKTGENQKLFTVETSWGSVLECTEYHKWYIHDIDGRKEKCTNQLVSGDTLISFQFPSIDGSSEFYNGYNDNPFLGQQCVIIGIRDNGRVSDTYCFSEPKRHMGVFNGLLTGQCNEIWLHSSPEYTYSCVLSSMNLAKWDEWKDTEAVFWATIFLDCVASEFLIKSEGMEEMGKIRAFTEKSRALGLGVLGYHTYIQQQSWVFGGIESHIWNNTVFADLQEESLRASTFLAKELGEPEWCKGYGVRTTHRTAVAPTMSTSIIMGGISQGIEPIYENVFTQSAAGAGESERINPIFLKLLKERGKYNPEVLEDINDKGGSVQHLDWLSEHEKRVFRTAFEINQFVILRKAGNRQRFICQGQSLNLFFSQDEDEEHIAQVHKEAFLNPLILGLYYLRTSGKAAKHDKDAGCEVCQ